MITLATKRPNFLRKLAGLALVLTFLTVFTTDASAQWGRGWGYGRGGFRDRDDFRGRGYYGRGYGYGPGFYNRGYGGFYNRGYGGFYNRGYGGFYGYPNYYVQPYVTAPIYSGFGGYGIGGLGGYSYGYSGLGFGGLYPY